jgi:peroxiredoxin
MPTTLIPGQPVPPLTFPLLGGQVFDITQSKPGYLTLVEVYRGLHCPRCHRHILGLNSVMPRLAERGVNVVAVSADPQDRAQTAKDKWGIDALPLGYDLDEATARAWGLFISNPITPNEPKPFYEPGTFFVRPDGVLFAVSLGSTPFGRAHWPDWLEGLDAAKARNYPPRGDRA